jgi:TRAP-type C4-dicarboxylate transport system substrate-binding protein
MTARAALLVLVVALLAGCGGGTDRTGKPTQGKVTVLTLANANFQPYELQPFADAVRTASGGRLRIRFLNDYRKDEPAAEKGIIDDVRHGKADLAWVGARAFDWVGDHAFEPLQAPLLIDSYDAERAVLRSDVPATLLASLKPLGLDGLGILPGPLRKLVTVKELRASRGLAGMTVAFSGGPAVEAALRTLGAEPLRIASGPTSAAWDASETHLQAAAGNHVDDDAGFLAANVNLWPRFPVIFAGPSARKQLSAGELALLRRAAVAARRPVFAAIAAAERGAMTQLCKGLDVRELSPQGLRGLREAAQPVYDSMAEDPAAAEVLERLEHLRAGVGAPASGAPKCPAKAAGPSPLDGTWVGQAHIVGPLTRFRWVIARGVYKQLELAGGRWVVGDEGKISVYRDHFEIVSSGDGSHTTGTWHLDGDTLRISHFGTADSDPIGVKVFAGHPWRRAAGR